jgi:ferredoxin
MRMWDLYNMYKNPLFLQEHYKDDIENDKSRRRKKKKKQPQQPEQTENQQLKSKNKLLEVQRRGITNHRADSHDALCRNSDQCTMCQCIVMDAWLEA